MRSDPAWTRRLAATEAPAHERLATALIEDILGGAVRAGARLPAHRDLAAALDLSVGTITRAYATLQRRGLARSEHGRGMFVLAAPKRAAGRIDFSVNLPPPVLTARMLDGLMAEAASGFDPQDIAGYAPPAGLPQHRERLSRHLAAMRGFVAPAERLLITAGAQQAIFAAFAAAPGGPVAVEAVTYPLALAALRRLGRPTVALPLDEEGVRPDALEAALRSADPPRVLYLVPTLQNPTGATMGEARRARIAELAHRHDLVIVEDDIYAALAPEAPPSLAALAPDHAFHLGSFSKSFGPGLRIGHLLCPPRFAAPALAWLQAMSTMPSPLACRLMQVCLDGGVAASVAGAIRQEAARRNALARGILGDAVAPAAPAALHLWLPMPTRRAAEIVRRAAARDILLAPPDAFQADPEVEEAGLRLCLGALPEADLAPALQAIVALLTEQDGARLDERAIV